MALYKSQRESHSPSLVREFTKEVGYEAGVVCSRHAEHWLAAFKVLDSITIRTKKKSHENTDRNEGASVPS